MNHFPRSILGAAIAAILAAPVAVQAQTADATLRGKAPADSEVTARNVATGATRRVKAGSDGTYTIAAGTYTVSPVTSDRPGVHATSDFSVNGRHGKSRHVN